MQKLKGFLRMPTTSDNMAEKPDVKTLQASFPPGTLNEISERGKTGTVVLFNFNHKH
jgi:hypothetical protein